MEVIVGYPLAVQSDRELAACGVRNHISRCV